MFCINFDCLSVILDIESNMKKKIINHCRPQVNLKIMVALFIDDFCLCYFLIKPVQVYTFNLLSKQIKYSVVVKYYSCPFLTMGFRKTQPHPCYRYEC